jgi:hypothetical protein
MNKEEPGKKSKPTTFQPGKKVFDVVRPGKFPAASNSRSVVVGHKPQVPDDQFVPSTHTRLAGDPFEKRPLMDPSDKVGLSPLNQDLESSASAPSPREHSIEKETAEPVTAPETEAPSPVTISEEKLHDTPDKEEITEPEPQTPTEPSSPSEPLADTSVEPKDTAFQPRPEQLAVEQVVEKRDLETDTSQPEAPQESRKPMTPDDVLTETEAPTLQQAVVSHHKSRTKPWEWLLIFLLILLLATAALNFLLDAEVLTTDLDIPHTNFLKNN